MQKYHIKESSGKALEKTSHLGNRLGEIIGHCTSRRYILFFAISITILAAMGWYVWDSFERLDKFESQKDEMAELRGIIIHLDEVLTMSARMAAAILIIPNKPFYPFRCHFYMHQN